MKNCNNVNFMEGPYSRIKPSKIYYDAIQKTVLLIERLSEFLISRMFASLKFISSCLVS